jgi:hypothetical protein
VRIFEYFRGFSPPRSAYAQPTDENREKPVLRYVECHLVEHCNLSCKRCGHFSPLAPKHEADPAALERDLRQLAIHLDVARIRLMGGEPTLHSNPAAFVNAAHAVFPKAELRVVTNGTRLKAMPNAFWEACRRANAAIDLSLYPVMDKGRPAIEEICAREGVKLNVSRQSEFLSWINPRGDSDPSRAMADCRSLFYCPLLKDGRLYVCVLPKVVPYYNHRFGQSIPTDGGIDIYEPDLDGHKILERLNTPVETCRFCDLGARQMHKWENDKNPRVEDYFVS